MSAATKTATSASPSRQVPPRNHRPELLLPPPALISARNYSILTRPPARSSTGVPQQLLATVVDSPKLTQGTQQLLEQFPAAPLTTEVSTFAPASLRDAAQTRKNRKPKPAAKGLSGSEVPAWLSVLIAIQRGSTPITFLLVVGVLAIYGWSVYSQRAWSQAYRQLSQLQREERELIAASETRKHQIAKQAESPRTGLVPQVPTKIVFLPSEPLPKVQSLKLKSPEIPLASQSLMGY